MQTCGGNSCFWPSCFSGWGPTRSKAPRLPATAIPSHGPREYRETGTGFERSCRPGSNEKPVCSRSDTMDLDHCGEHGDAADSRWNPTVRFASGREQPISVVRFPLPVPERWRGVVRPWIFQVQPLWLLSAGLLGRHGFVPLGRPLRAAVRSVSPTTLAARARTVRGYASPACGRPLPAGEAIRPDRTPSSNMPVRRIPTTVHPSNPLTAARGRRSWSWRGSRLVALPRGGRRQPKRSRGRRPRAIPWPRSCAGRSP